MYRRQALLADVPAHLTWERYCGFLDLSTPAFMQIQRRRLMETLPALAKSGIGRTFLGGHDVSTVEQLRRAAPLTSFDDYRSFFQPLMSITLPEPPIFWAKTSRLNLDQAMIPYNQAAFEHLMDGSVAAFLLAAADGRGQTRLEPQDRVLYNFPPSPYLSGMLAQGLTALIRLRPVVDFDEAEELDFQDKVALGFKRALHGGVDVVASMPSVLLKMGESFEQRSNSRSALGLLRNPRVAWRMLAALLKSKREGRSMLPKDIWKLKGLVCWGTDTGVYRDQIRHYWGCDPYEFLAITEGGILAMQSWTREGMTFVPGTNFLEFIRETDALAWNGTGSSELTTCLLDELEPGERYEVVITSCVGMPFLRYRTGVLVDVLATADEEAGIALPQVRPCGRVHDLIDIAGFTRLDEGTIAAAMRDAGLSPFTWTARREYEGPDPVLRVYMERNGRDETDVQIALHRSLLDRDNYYRDLQEMLAIRPLRIAVVESGAFRAYASDRRARGVDLDRQSVPHINATDEAIEELMLTSRALIEAAGVAAAPTLAS
ncbi:MAG: GH3 auxin-responsive promoter family protein [Chloroflexi bacterium]|nr:GH3 auxin-responsive promoter family protein [Chloroflexota bacterium]